MILNGRVGQVLGPFTENIDLLSDEGAISKAIPESNRPTLTKLGIQAPVGTIVQINDVKIKIVKTGIYELDGVVGVKSLIFPDGVDGTAIVDFVY